MAAQGIERQSLPIRRPAFLFWLAAVVATALSLAAFFAGLRTTEPPVPPLQDALAAREQRIAFFEARALADPIDFLSRSKLAGEYLQRARERGDAGDYLRAEEAATSALELDPQNYGALIHLSSLRQTQHDYAAARDLAEKAVELRPNEAAGHGAFGDALLGLGQYLEAGQAYQAMVEIEPALPALSRLAHLAFLQGDEVDAVDFWKQAISRAEGLPRENLAWAHVQLAGVYFSQGDLATAWRENERALALVPGYVHALAGNAAVRAAQGRLDEAASLYLEATERLPLPQYVATLGDVYAKLGRDREAEDQYALVEAIDALYRASGINTDLQLALFYADHDRESGRALTLAENAYAQSPGVYAADALAWALFQNGRYREASERSAEALRLGTPDPMLHYHAARISLALGEPNAALGYLKQALDLNPRFSVLHTDDARLLLSALKSGQ